MTGTFHHYRERARGRWSQGRKVEEIHDTVHERITGIDVLLTTTKWLDSLRTLTNQPPRNVYLSNLFIKMLHLFQNFEAIENNKLGIIIISIIIKLAQQINGQLKSVKHDPR